MAGDGGVDALKVSTALASSSTRLWGLQRTLTQDVPVHGGTGDQVGAHPAMSIEHVASETRLRSDIP